MPRLKPTPEEIDAGAKLINDYGGATKLARAINDQTGADLAPQAISNWKVRGIPYDYRGTLVVLAQAQNITLPPDFFRTKGRSG